MSDKDKGRILARAEALNIRQLFHPFSLLDDAQWDYWIADELPEEEEYKNEIRAALRILRPKHEEQATCRLTIRHALGIVNRAEADQSILSPRSKKSEAAMKRLTAALKKARAAYKSLPPLEQIHLDKVFDLAGAVEFCEQRTGEWKEKPMPKARTSHRQRAAVEMAYKLVEYWLVKKRNLHEAVKLTRKNEWHQLSGILFGNARVDLLAHMTRYQPSSRKPGAK
jgi:hypothetical protein